MRAPSRRSINDLKDVTFMGKVPPQCVEIEESVIGSTLTYDHIVMSLVKVLKPEHFYKLQHQIIWQTILELYEDQKPIDTLTVTDSLKVAKKLEEVGGPYFISLLTDKVSGSTNTNYHAYLILQKYMLRQIIFVASLNINKAYDEEDPFELITDFRMSLDELDRHVTTLSTQNAKSAVEETMKNMHAAISGKAIPIYDTGHDQFDELVGISRNEILMVAGPAGQGKTKFVTSLMFKLLQRHTDIAVDWYSFEDPMDKLIRCHIASLTGIDDKTMKNKSKKKKLTMDDLAIIAHHADTIKRYDIEFHDSKMFIDDIKYSFTRFCAKRPTKMNICVIDNLLLVDSKLKFTERDDYIMSTISSMRQATNGLIIPIHHFSDEQQSTDRAKVAYRPRLKDMKGSEAYRRVPTQILLVNKPGEYADMLKLYNDRPEMPYLFITDCAKNRDGATTIGDEKGIIRWFADLKLNIFHEY